MIKNFVKILELLGDRLEFCVSVLLRYEYFVGTPQFLRRAL